MKLLITDLDNTLYDWITFFSQSFIAMVRELIRLLDTDEETILRQFRVVHQRYENSEQPFAALELPVVKKKYPNATPKELLCLLDPAFHAFNSTRKKTLKLYPGVRETLTTLQKHSIILIGYTEAIIINSYNRLIRLDISNHFSQLYSLEGKPSEHPNPNRPQKISPKKDFISPIPRSEGKPNPAMLLKICQSAGCAPKDTVYVGDSVTKDIAMARDAGITSVWARYGRQVKPEYWQYLVKITHWTDEDVKREQELRRSLEDVQPDYIIDSFEEILKLWDL